MRSQRRQHGRLAQIASSDQIVDDRAYTAAVDLSVNCLGEDDIKQLLSALADSGLQVGTGETVRTGGKGELACTRCTRWNL